MVGRSGGSDVSAVLPALGQTEVLTVLLRLEAIAVPAAAAVLKEAAAAHVDVEEEVVLHGLAGPRVLLHHTQLVEDEGRSLGL